MKRITGSRRGWMPRLIAALLTAMIWVLGASQAHAYEEVIYYHNDALGSPVLATDASGNVKWREAYAPYGARLLYQSRETDCTLGACRQVESPWDEKQWFTGKLEETAQGIQYFGARWYDPEIGRFLSVDPVDFNENNIFSFNRYAYANNNPYRYTDPDGQSPLDVVFLAIDVGKLAYAVYQGDGAAIQAAAVDVALSALGVISPVPGVGQALKVAKIARSADNISDAARTASGAKSAIKSADDVAKRPGSFRKKTVKDDWDNAANGTKPDTKACPTCGKNVSGNPHKGEKRNGADGWDVDHQPKWKDRDLSGMDRKQVLGEFNKDTQLRCSSCNRADNQ